MENYYHYPTETTGISQESVMARKTVRDALRGHWQEDEDFFNKFFPVTPVIRETASKVKALHFFRSRWKRIPSNPNSVDYRMYSPLNGLFNAILSGFKLLADEENPRLFLKTYRCRVISDASAAIWPGILLAGAGASFIWSTGTRPEADYVKAISPIEVVLENSDMGLARERLAAYVQFLFEHQPNRRFAFGVVISQTSLTCHLFDHSGVLSSPSLKYHTEPSQFCALVSGLASLEDELIGLDTTLYFDKNNRHHVHTKGSLGRGVAPKSVTYTAVDTLFYAPRLVGRGTLCFLIHKQHDTREIYVVKDTWTSIGGPELAGKESEADLLLHAQRQGVVKGVVQICHSEEVRLKGRNGRLAVDSIWNNRRVYQSESSVVNNGNQRVHTRIVMATYGKTLLKFSTRMELLLALYDAVQGELFPLHCLSLSDYTY